MADNEEIDPRKVRSGLCALVTARLEDAHENAVKGQAINNCDPDFGDLVCELRSMADEMLILIDAIELLRSR